MNPFDYVRLINEKGKVDDVMGFVPYLTVNNFSYSLDTVMLANELNCHPNLPPECQFDFLYHTVKKGKRFNKWYKADENPHLELIMEYYGYSKEKALEALQILSPEQIEIIKKQGQTGGMSK